MEISRWTNVPFVFFSEDAFFRKCVWIVFFAFCFFLGVSRTDHEISRRLKLQCHNFIKEILWAQLRISSFNPTVSCGLTVSFVQ